MLVRVPRAAALAAIPLSLVMAACDVSLGHLTGRATEEWIHTYPLTPGGTIKIGNTNGRIEVEGADRADVEVRAEKIARAATDAGAQTVRGRVLEADTRKPVTGARVILRSPEDSTLAALTDQNGGFVARAPQPGRYEVGVARLGYRAQREGPFELPRGAIVDLEILLPVVPLTLDPVTVTAEVNSRFLQSVGFYHRQRSDFGHFITRDQVETRRASQTTGCHQYSTVTNSSSTRTR